MAKKKMKPRPKATKAAKPSTNRVAGKQHAKVSKPLPVKKKATKGPAAKKSVPKKSPVRKGAAVQRTTAKHNTTVRSTTVKKASVAKKAAVKKKAARKPVAPAGKTAVKRSPAKPIGPATSGRTAAKKTASTSGKIAKKPKAPARKKAVKKKAAPAKKKAAVKPSKSAQKPVPVRKAAASKKKNPAGKPVVKARPATRKQTPPGKAAAAPLKESAPPTAAPAKAALKQRYQLEFYLNASPGSLFELISTPSGFSEWFCDDVNVVDAMYTFKWGDESEAAECLNLKNGEYIRFRWAEDIEEDPGAFFELRIRIDGMTNETCLVVTDHAWPRDLEEEKALWGAQIQTLTRVLGA